MSKAKTSKKAAAKPATAKKKTITKAKPKAAPKGKEAGADISGHSGEKNKHVQAAKAAKAKAKK